MAAGMPHSTEAATFWAIIRPRTWKIHRDVSLDCVQMASRFQFSIRLILVVTASIGGVCAAVSAQPSWKSLIALECLTMFFVTWGVIFMKQTDGDLHYFWFGTAVGFSMAAVCAAHVIPWFVPYEHGVPVAELGDYAAGAAQSLRIVLPVTWLAALVNGTLAVGLRRLFRSSHGAQGP
jgi:hypothetical protein